MQALRRVGLRSAGWPRRILALLFLALALAAAPRRVRGNTTAPTRSVVVAARDLPAGATLAAGDLAVQPWGGALAPPGAFAETKQVVGRRIAGAVGRGEAVTDSRLLGPGVSDGLSNGQVAVAVAVSAGNAVLLRPGDTVELVQPPAVDGQAASVLTASARVLAIVPARGGAVEGGSATPADTSGAVTAIVAVDRAAVARLAAAGARPVLAAVTGDP